MDAVASKAAGEEAPVQAPVSWDPYEREEYVPLENPYDTSIIDEEPEVQSSDVDSDDEAFHTKARHVLRRLQSGKYDGHFAGGVYKCPFCKRHLRATDFNCLLNHAEALGSSRPNVGTIVNVYSFMAHHKALGIHLRKLHALKGRAC